MLFRQIYPRRWFVWTLVFSITIGLGLAGYIQWVTIQIDTENTLTYVNLNTK